MKTIVSVTPIAVERDSRTFKLASSMTRLGYRSIVYEAQASLNLSDDLPFELMTMNGSAGLLPTTVPLQRPGVDAVPIAPTSDWRASPRPTVSEPVQPGSRSTIVRWLDDLAALAPSWTRRLLGPTWARLLWRVQTSEVVAFLHLLASYLEMCRATATELPTADLYYLHAQSQLPAVWWRSRRGRVPFVYDAHDLYSLMRVNTVRMAPAAELMWRVWDVMEREAVRRADVCVTVGPGIAAHAKAQFGRSFAVLHNAHDPRLDTPVPEALRASLGLDDTALIVAVVGNFKPEFVAVRPLLEALQRLPSDVNIAFVGSQYDEPLRWAQELGVEERVHLRPPVPPTQIVSLVATADVLPILYHPVNADIRNALPNKFFQAVAAGVPVLYSRHLPDVRRLSIEHGLGWEFDPENPASIVVALRHLHQHRAELQRRREHVARVRDALSWPSEEPTLARILTDAIGEPAG